MRRLLISSLAASALWPVSSASAADAIAPRDGELVNSRPAFVFDVARGSAEIELSRTPETKTAGDDAGAFVEREESDFMLIGRTEPGVGYWDGDRINAGRYYWHVKADDYADDFSGDPRPMWSPTRTLVVRDEAVVFEGWTVRARRLRPRGRCATRVRLSGTIAWSDNAEDPAAGYSIRLIAGTRTIGRVTGTFDYSGETYDRVVCVRRRTRARRFVVSAALRDPGGHLAVGPRRLVSLQR